MGGTGRMCEPLSPFIDLVLSPKQRDGKMRSGDREQLNTMMIRCDAGEGSAVVLQSGVV